MTPPKVIYLQWYDEDGNEVDPHGGDVTWCDDRINDTDVAYIRADDMQEKKAECH